MSLPDETLRHLRRVIDEPDLAGTRYRLVGLLGRGGMGSVWEVEDRTLERHVALKVVGEAEGETSGVARIPQEARTMARLEHPGVVPVHEVGTLGDGRTYYAMKLVRGERLDVHLAERRALDDRLRVFERVLETMAFAHARGVVHRDLKPGNVMVGEFGEVLVLDWGVAFRGSAAEEPGTVVGTEGFMAPEQARGEIDATDARADVFALGRMLAEILREGEGRPSAALRAISRCAAAVDPGERYADASELRDDLRRERAGLQTRALPDNPLRWLVRFHRRYAAAIWLIAAYLVMRIALLWLPTG
ncbi:MAG: serine/threonine-protein kinase [Planctomycetota bacterium]